MITKIPLDIVHIDCTGGCHILVKCKFNGKVSGNLIVDTGASKTVFDMSSLDKMVEKLPKCKTDIHTASADKKPLKSKMGIIKKLAIGDLILENLTIVLIDLQNVNSVYKFLTNKKIWGLLGSDFLNELDAKIDYRKLELSLRYK